MQRKDLGFDIWFAASGGELHQDGCRFARVSAVDRGSYLIADGLTEVTAELTGKLSYQIENSDDLPAVGDWVTAHYYNDDEAALILQVLPRKSFLRRKTAGSAVEYQMIAANIDTAFIVQSCHFDFNPRRLERYLIMAADGHVEPVIILTKTDLIGPEELERRLATVNKISGAAIIALSAVTGDGFDQFRTMLLAGKTYCLLGSSGVGKTTLINRLIGQDTFATQAVSNTGEGIHTTTRRQLIILPGGAMLIDTPGMRELGLIGTGDGIESGFEEFFAYSGNCRYPDCSHEHEPGCAVRAAIERGEVSADRYASYLKLKKESAFHEMSYREKRQKDKDFGRLIKSVKQRLRK